MDERKLISKTFLEIADALEKGKSLGGHRIGLTTLGSEHGEKALLQGALLAKKQFPQIDVVLIGPKNDTGLETLEANNEDEQYKVMEEALDSKNIEACVTMHYNFPIGVSTVGKVVAPANGREVYIATTTGTSSAHRVEGMVKNAIYGIIAAKAAGVEKPKVGILNVDGARAVEIVLKNLKAKGYDIEFGESERADGGAVLRGNDLLMGAVDVVVTDTLTGNLLIKLFSSFTSGGKYETTGSAYGPGIGEGYDRNVLILSRASGTPVIANAIKYGYDVVHGGINKLAEAEFKKLNAMNWLSLVKKDDKKAEKKEAAEIKAPNKVPVTGSISGIDIMELEDAVKVVWAGGIYAESGMGCTGPVLLVPEDKVAESTGLLAKAGFLAAESSIC
ncbi:glycine/sarcosine/betaine reductase complex component C subunit alpha [Proteiniclasticum sp. QWL-01]|uniref:glycine/sarcosine/betaine reductase complex component C subunit alpha n=1 Tax=Proteiniclasticum sp. QWL-01 TaxID=3036945 RepID=UPI00220D750B|nr:glycine/sarcosine/betaine reductase complex component C subunit alpha [Proteiniclasticum sp. QWL-01]UUM11676.1 glycine/sarcosine/betaine reductase complex component C subunit alpha [Clostridiaceae bacterium HFYG-1003]WFF73145.1 glycine/sarcosine/betaine reductase complex component C subunit alpha [Proteiniclasticum sp. QWL-01]